MKTPDFPFWTEGVVGKVEAFLEDHLPDPQLPPQRLHEAMRYATLNGGKRVRPLLVFAAGALTDAPEEALTVVGSSIELIHAYSLVHDDLPCMDNDVLRRGQPTCHVKFGEATALLAGDTLQSLAFQWLSEFPLFEDAPRQLRMLQQLALASGSRGMGGGQALDLENTGTIPSLPELEAMHLKKTGALIRTAILLGADCGRTVLPSGEQRALVRFANALGLAFQVVDDILDTESDTVTLGKTAGKDAAGQKATYVGIMGLPQAKALAADLFSTSCDALAPFGSRGRRLQELAYLVHNRRH